MLTLSKPNIPQDAHGEISAILDTGMLIHGKTGVEFERALGALLGAKHVISCSSGTAALHLAYLASDLCPGDWVLVPDFTFPATVSAAIYAGLRPFVIDVDAKTYNIDTQKLRHALEHWPHTERPKAIMVVHEFGAPAGMDAIHALADDYNLIVLEDAACAIGATYNGKLIGSESYAACFSFHPRKVLTTGEGGAIVTNDEKLADQLRLFRNHGMVRANNRVDFKAPGLNYRLTEFQSALGLSQVPLLLDWIETRRALAKVYLDALRPLEEAGAITLPEAVRGHSWQTFMIVLADRFDRSAVITAMAERGFQTGLGAQSVTDIGFAFGAMTVGPQLFHQGLALPFCEQYSMDQISAAAAALRNVLETCGTSS